MMSFVIPVPVAYLATPALAQLQWLSLLFIGPARVRRVAKPEERTGSPDDVRHEA
jgi:hypothetical protein